MADEYAGEFETGASAPAVPHLAFLDGLRGIAALYVVLHHSWQVTSPGIAAPGYLVFLRFGRAAVTVFIAISGFSLSLPVVRSGRTLRGGALHFYKKRARRIVVPYYISLAMGIGISSFLLNPAGHRMAWFEDPFTQRAFFSHLFFVQNWSPHLEFMFNGPLWSVAVEMQIYLLFPVMVLLWRRFGMGWMLASSMFVGHVVLFLAGHRGSANYLFIFALGVWAAEYSHQKRSLFPLKVILFFSTIAFLAFPNAKVVISDAIVGVGVSCLMVLCTRTSSWPGSILSFRLFTWLGSFSYSIYLIHGPIQSIYVDASIRALPGFTPGYSRLLFMCFALTPIILALSYVFHFAIERPFMTAHKVRIPARPPKSTDVV